MIPKIVYTIWFGDMPPLVQECIETQKKMCEDFGYDHNIITLDNYPSGLKYVEDALSSRNPDGVKYCKVSDYLRMYYLIETGGIYLDADVEILPGKNFDHLLNEEMFVGKEQEDPGSGTIVLGTAVIGAEPGHPMLLDWKKEVDEKFSGDDALNYESSMDLLNTIGVRWQHKMTLLPPDVFYPINSVTQEYNFTAATICTHHFLKSWTPKSLIEQFTYNIENGVNFTFVKRGDGELACMNGEPGGNCDGHPYSKELGNKLKEAYRYLEQAGAHIVEFDDQVNYNVLLHRTDSNLKEVSEFYKAIFKSRRLKYFIGPEKLSEVAKIMLAIHIVIPEVNFFSQYDQFKNLILRESYQIDYKDENAIFIFCAGMPAKPLIAELHKENPNATYLDCGSAFDPSVGQTRTYQISKEEFWALYARVYHTKIDGKDSWLYAEEQEAVNKMKDDIKKYVDPVVQNFYLPQETHPERIWVLTHLPADGYIADLGCGSHKTIPSAIGIDIRPVADVQADISEPPLRPNFCDVIISRHSLEHLLDPVTAIKNWTAALKPCGKMLIVLPDHERINTMAEIYSAGQHLHAYTMASFSNFISLFPDLAITEQGVVLKDWSFGTVVYKLPTVSIVIPQLGREEGLKKCLESIDKQTYPRHLIEVLVIEGETETVPQKVEKGAYQSRGEYICYAANDMTFEPDAILTAVKESLHLGKGLVSFNSGPLLPDKGNINEHFIISRELVKRIGGYIFDLSFFHAGCDNYLWQQCEDLGQAYHSEAAKVEHNHFSKGGKFDAVYEKGWARVNTDRKTLVEKLSKLKQ